MVMDDIKAANHAEDWCVILQSFHPKQKKELVKRLSEVFDLDRRDAEKAVANTPLIILDLLPFTTAGRIKNFLQKLGAVVEITNHDMIKKNCFQILWPEVPDLAFFLKEETKPAVEEPRVEGGQAPVLPVDKYETPGSVEPVMGSASTASPAIEGKPTPVPVPKPDADGGKQAKEFLEKPVKTQDEQQKREKTSRTPQKEVEQKETLPSSETNWRSKAVAFENRIHELEVELGSKSEALEKLGKEREKVGLELEKTKESSSKTGNLEKLLEVKEKDLQTLQTEVQQWMQRTQALEKAAAETTSAKEAMARELEEGKKREKELLAKVDNLERMTTEARENLKKYEDSIKMRDATLETLEKRITEFATKAQSFESTIFEKTTALGKMTQELNMSQTREKDLLEKTETLEHQIAEMRTRLQTREEELKARDATIASLEKRIADSMEKIQEAEALRQENAKFSQERAALRKEYEAKIAEMEAQHAKLDEENRRYRSRAERKMTAATRELGEWTRGVDALRQGLQKLTQFLGSESAVPEVEKKSPFRTLFPRASNPPNKPNS